MKRGGGTPDSVGTMTRCRVVLSIVFALLLIGAVASWSRSRLALDMVSYRVGEVQPPRGGVENVWTYRARAIGVSHRHGKIGVVRTHHTSAAAAREDLQELVDAQGLHSISVPISLVKPLEDRGWAGFRSATDWNVLGLGMSSSSRAGNESWTVDVPHWMLGAVFGAGLFKLAVVPWFRWRRGRCPKCAYNLKGVVAASCPECGWDRGDTAPVLDEPGEMRRAA